MTEQPKASEAKHTPEPWRWGFWKPVGRSLTQVEFRPPDERAPGNDPLVLTNWDYGHRRNCITAAPDILVSEPLTDWGDSSTILVANPADMALIASAPETASQRDQLLAACEALLRLHVDPTVNPQENIMPTLDATRAAIARAKETDNG